MRQVIRSRVRGAADIDDIIQEIAAAVLNQDNRPTTHAKIAPWLYGVTIRQASQFLRKQARHEKLLEKAQEHTPELPALPNPRDWVIAHEKAHDVQSALEKLSPEHREIFLLKYNEGLTYRELADLFETTVKAVEHRLLQARQTLRHHLTKDPFDDSNH